MVIMVMMMTVITCRQSCDYDWEGIFMTDDDDDGDDDDGDNNGNDDYNKDHL